MMLYGVTRHHLRPGDHYGSCWMIADERAPSIQIALHRAFLPELEALQAAHHKLVAEAWSGNSLHLTWLIWLGFKRLSARRAGPFNEEFIIFERIG